MKRTILSILLAVMTVIGTIPAITAADVPAPDTAAVTEAPSESVTEPVSQPATAAPTQAPAAPKRAAKKLSATSEETPKITLAAPSSKGIKLAWEAYPDAAKYMVFIRKPDDSGWKKIGESASTSFEHKNPISDTTYVYTVRAADKNSRFISAIYERYSFYYLSAPVLTRTESLTKGQKVSWKPVDGAVYYRVYLKNGASWILAATVKTNYIINTKVTSGKAYTYTVRCWDNVNRISQSYFDTKGLTGVYVGTPKIASFSAAKNGLTLNWDKMNGAAAYAVFRKSDTGWKKIGSTAKTSYTDSGLTAGTTYTYTLRCMNANGKLISGYDTAGASFSYIRPPKVKSISFNDGQYTVTWKETPPAAYYRVFRKEYGTAKWKYVGKSATDSFTDTSAKKDGVYTYTVRAMDENNNYLSYFTESDRYYCLGIFVIGSLGNERPDTHPVINCEVTEDELRQLTAVTASGWLGAVEGDDVHKDILSFYNLYTPLPYGYKMQTHDAWCAAFVSAVWIRSGLANYTGTECGCGRFIDVAKQNNAWVESDSYMPKVGDAVIYNWSDSGAGECTTGADHVGIVTEVNGSQYIVTEGNTGTGYCGTHDRVVNGRFIRGFITPNYKQIAAFISMRSRYI